MIIFATIKILRSIGNAHLEKRPKLINEFISRKTMDKIKVNGYKSFKEATLNLRPQTYNFGVQLSIGNTDTSNWCDAVKPAVQLTILNDAIFTPGVNLQECRGHQALVPAKFI